MSEYKKTLLSMIEKVISEEWSIPEFRTHYYDYYLEEVPDNHMSDHDLSFFGAVQEKLDWVDSKPDLESRTAGWIDYDSFLKWLIKTKSDHSFS